jgi:hypothetical protein
LNESTFGLLGASFDPRRDITDLSGKVIFVTGGNLQDRVLQGFPYGCHHLLISCPLW